MIEHQWTWLCSQSSLQRGKSGKCEDPYPTKREKNPQSTNQMYKLIPSPLLEHTFPKPQLCFMMHHICTHTQVFYTAYTLYFLHNSFKAIAENNKQTKNFKSMFRFNSLKCCFSLSRLADNKTASFSVPETVQYASQFRACSRFFTHIPTYLHKSKNLL